eukprot:1156099-Pelagomonas_calceolata.AAC.7
MAGSPEGFAFICAKAEPFICAALPCLMTLRTHAHTHAHTHIHTQACTCIQTGMLHASVLKEVVSIRGLGNPFERSRCIQEQANPVRKETRSTSNPVRGLNMFAARCRWHLGSKD